MEVIRKWGRWRDGGGGGVVVRCSGNVRGG